MKAEFASLPVEVATDRLNLLLEGQDSPAEAMAALSELMKRQTTWTDRCAVEMAMLNLLVIEHFKRRCRNEQDLCSR